MENDSSSLLHGINPVDPSKVQTATLDVVFIHGLDGHPVDTWCNTEEKFWLRWLSKEFSDIAVWSIGYNAAPSAWLDDTMTMEERALNILNDLSLTNPIGNRPIFFIVHSLGGLILKFILEKSDADDDYRVIIDQTKGVAFLATPHEGSSGANFLTNLSIFYRANDIVKQLQKHSSSLSRIDDVFNTMVRKKRLKCFSFYEKKEVRIKRKGSRQLNEV